MQNILLDNAKIELININNEIVYTTKSNAKGEYSLDALIDKSYTFKVSITGYYKLEMINFEPVCDEVRTVNVKLCPQNK